MNLGRDTRSRSGLRARLIAAVLAPVFFCVPVGLGLVFVSIFAGAGFRRRRTLPMPFGIELDHALVAIALVVVIVPAVIGFCLGPTRFPTFLGHCFYTNGRDERSLPATVAIWGIALALACALCVSM